MRRALWLVCVLIGLASRAEAQVAYDASAQASCNGGTCTSGTTLSYNITVGSGSNRALVVFVFIGCGSADTAPAVSTATYNGGTLGAAVQSTTGGTGPARRGYMYAIAAPTSGTNAIQIVLASTLGACTGGVLTSGAIATTGVNQSSLFTSSNVNSGSGTSATLTLSSSNANDLGVQAVCAGNGVTSTTETSRFTENITSNSCGSIGGATAAGSDTSFSWSIPSDSWLMLGGALADVGGGGGGGGTTPRLLLLGVGGSA